MHDAGVVILDVIRVHVTCAVLHEVVFVPRRDVICVNGDVVVTVRSALFVVHAYQVAKLVDDDSFLQVGNGSKGVVNIVLYRTKTDG